MHAPPRKEQGNHAMSERTGTETGAGTVTAGAQGATEPHRDIREAVFVSPKSPRINASAREMAEFLDSYADQLRRVAEQLRTKGEGGTIALPWPPHGPIMYCNGPG